VAKNQFDAKVAKGKLLVRVEPIQLLRAKTRMLRIKYDLFGEGIWEADKTGLYRELQLKHKSQDSVWKHAGLGHQTLI